jgi:hypothetical protein
MGSFLEDNKILGSSADINTGVFDSGAIPSGIDQPLLTKDFYGKMGKLLGCDECSQPALRKCPRF